MCFSSVHIVLNKLSEYKYFYISKNITSYTLLHDSHKKREDSLGTRAILIEIFMLCWNLPSSPKLWGVLQKIWLSLKGITCLQVIFVLIWMKQTLIWYNLQRDGTGNGFSNIKDTFATANISSAPKYVHLQVFKACLSSSHDGLAKYKKKLPEKWRIM